ncbi:hypothetical protein ACFX15_012146 [Malus domestica]
MLRYGLEPNQFTLSSLLKASGAVSDNNHGRQLHTYCFKCGHMDESQLVFDALDIKNEVSWNALIAGHARKAQGEHAFRLFWKKQGAAPYRIFNLGNTSPVTVPTLVNILEQHMLVYELRLTRLKVWSIFLDDLEFSSLIASAQSPQIDRSWCISFTVATYAGVHSSVKPQQ